MENTAYIALSRQMVLRQKMDLVAHNLANLNTPGFKGEDMLFVEYLDTSTPQEPLSYVQNISMIRDLENGTLTPTENPLDLAINGEGYFVVETPEGRRYTRNGAFSLNAERQIVTASGLALLSNAGSPLEIPANSSAITITRDGTVSSERGPVGRIDLVTFANEQQLKKIGGGLFDAEDQQPEPLQDGEVQQGMIEGSNVKGVVEMTRMIETLRSYQAASKLIDEEHRRQREAISRIVATGQA